MRFKVKGFPQTQVSLVGARAQQEGRVGVLVVTVAVLLCQQMRKQRVRTQRHHAHLPLALTVKQEGTEPARCGMERQVQ
eukprot:CAMPEP_0177650056 /NCGR_PEP_ID=MMETSP0447-20121125/11726_1 /TAXON_ID=0 /ORGANISM="Stygamoeba regulata, Strain BSH-02190019" /LENGTH=78 /DNA_ID=CAMNT_0019152875 /DNA_START=43 /DNA_END=279 /DNA_ORIENTATION=-